LALKILVTGSKGFVGRKLIERLEQVGHDVYRLNRQPGGQDKDIIYHGHESLPSNLPNFDIVIHLAAKVEFSGEFNPQVYFDNTILTLRIVKYCFKNNAYLIFASTIGIHGNSKQISESSPMLPQNPYAVSKYLSEQIIQEFLSQGTILRICGIYGLDGPSHLSLNSSITEAFYHQKSPTLIGSGESKRNYISVSDVSKWILHIVDSYNSRSLVDFNRGIQILYLAGPETMTIKQYLQEIILNLLPGKCMLKKVGPDGTDCIVQGSEPSFPLTSFRDYLRSLK